jgi:phage-related minor tail protein
MATAQNFSIRMTLDTSTLSSGLAQATREVTALQKEVTGQIEMLNNRQQELMKSDSLKRAAEEKSGVLKKAAEELKATKSFFSTISSSTDSAPALISNLMQGGRTLVDESGGVGAAASALTSGVGQMATRFNLATTAVQLLSTAYAEGSKEAKAYSTALTMTGNYSGLTVGQSKDMAVRIAGADGTQFQAAEAIAAVAGTGKIGSQAIEDVANATSAMNRVLGVSINEAVGNFVKLAEEPSKASAQLNQTYHYLNVSTYDRIAALEKQGKTEEAAALAQSSFANAMKQRTQQVVGNLGTMERAWLAITNTAKRGWDALLNIGREESPEQKLEAVRKKIANIDQLIANKGFGVNGAGAAFGRPASNADLQRTRDELATQESALAETVKLGNNAAQRASEEARKNQAAIKDRQDKDSKESKTTGGASGVTRPRNELLEKELEAERESYRKKARVIADGIKEVDSLRKRELIGDYDVVRRKRDLQIEDIGNRETSLRNQLEAIKSRKGDESEGRRVESQLTETLEQRGFVETEANRAFGEIDSAAQLSQLRTMRQATDAIREQTSAMVEQNAVHGLSASAIKEVKIAQLERQLVDLEATDRVIPGYIDELRQRIDAEKSLLQVTRESEGIKSAEDKKKEQEGRSKKLSDDLNGTFKEGITGLMQGQEGAIDKMAESLKKKVSGALADALYDATLKPAVEKFTGWLSNSITGLFNGGGSGGGSGGGGGGGNWFGSLVTSVLGFFGVGSAKGNVFSSPGLHAYSSSIVDRPTFFPFAKGIGLMGEAGAEAIMPLRRGTDGRLGVSLQGGGAAAQALHFAPSNVFYIDSRSDRGAVMADLDRVLQANNEGQMEQLKRMRVVPQ